KNNIKPKETIKLWIDTEQRGFYEEVRHILQRQVNAEQLDFVTAPQGGSIAVVVQTDKLYIEADLPEVNKDQQRSDMEKELNYLKGFLESVEKKLANDRFVRNAKPEIIENERKKQADAVAKIKAL